MTTGVVLRPWSFSRESVTMFRDPQVLPDTRDTSAQDHGGSPLSEDSCIRHKLARQKVNMLLELHAIDEHHWTWCYSCRCVVTTPPCATVQDHNWNSVKLTTSALDSGHTIATIEPRYEAMQAEPFLSALAWHCVISSSFPESYANVSPSSRDKPSPPVTLAFLSGPRPSFNVLRRNAISHMLHQNHQQEVLLFLPSSVPIVNAKSKPDTPGALREAGSMTLNLQKSTAKQISQTLSFTH